MTSQAENEPNPILTAGQLLREARIKSGVHVAVLSVHLKVPVQQLEAIEADQFDPTKGPVFYRGLAASMCRKLNVDPAPVLALMPRPSGQLGSFKSTHQPLTSGHVHLNRAGVLQAMAASKAFWLGALLLALTLSFVWMPSPSQWVWLDLIRFNSASNPSSTELIEEVNLVSPRLSSEAVNSSASNQTLTFPSATPSNRSSLGAQTVSPLPSTAQEAPAITPPKMALSSANTRTASWVFNATGESWLELRDASNRVVWSGVLKAGDNTRIESPLPVRVVVGRAQAVTVTLRGVPFDLKPHTQVAVARFEVKE